MTDQPAGDLVADDQLIARLGQLAPVLDPAPPTLLDSARALFGLGRLDADLAQLVRDSADAPERSLELAVRAADDDRLLSFESGAAGVEMQISERADRRDIVCHVTGVPLRDAQLETTTGRQALRIDDGVLIARDLAAGPLRLRLTTTAGTSIVTSWVRV
jgi:hypothetical protein